MRHYKKQFLEDREVSIPMQGTKSTIFPPRMLLQLKSFLNETLIEKMTFVVMKDE